MLQMMAAPVPRAKQKPPGAQIKRWYLTLIILIFIINVSAIVSLWLVQKAVSDIVIRHEPLMRSAELINTDILEAQLHLSRYLSEYERDLTKANVPLDAALAESDQALLQTDDAALRQSIDNIKVSIAKFKKALKELKDAKGGGDWRQVEEYRRAAVSLGNETQTLAQKVKAETESKIKAKNVTSLLTAKIVFIIILVLFLVSLVVVWAVLYWWRRFQDVLLEI